MSQSLGNPYIKVHCMKISVGGSRYLSIGTRSGFKTFESRSYSPDPTKFNLNFFPLHKEITYLI